VYIQTTTINALIYRL